MNEIFTRRSVRKYTGELIDEEQIKEIIKAGMNAPSGKNQQPWQFWVFDDKALIDSLVEISPQWKPLVSAGQGIVVCGDLSINDDPEYLFIDAAAAAQNILLQAEAMGYGACWLGVAPGQDRIDGVLSVLNLPENHLPVTLIAIGFKDEKKDINNRFLSGRIHFLNK